MSVKCTRCQSETCFMAEITGWSPGEVFRVYECPSCGRVDWRPAAQVSQATIPRHKPDDRAALS